MDMNQNTTAFTDTRDGEIYRTVKIGNQIWMAENLRYKCEGSCAYDNDETHVKQHGRLYHWKYAAKAVPEGWLLPSNKDWFELCKTLTSEPVENDVCEDKSIAGIGRLLKSKTLWEKDKDFECEGIDSCGFMALPSGCIGSYTFAEFGKMADFWSADGGKKYAFHFFLYNFSDDFYYGKTWNDSFTACSIRCVKDA